jgi:sodium-dependent dicarboxylate transporter 2/3/5
MDKRVWFVILGLALSLVILLLPVFSSMPRPARATLAVAVLMAVWWMTEAVPLAVTSLVPLVLFPCLQVSPVADVARNYGDHMVYLFLGGFMLATALERWNLHKRIAFRILLFMKGNLSMTLMGFLMATAFISMWVSNTAAALMMLPIALSVIRVAEEKLPPAEGRTFATMLLMAVAYASSVGGMGTLIGSPPNLVLAGFMPKAFPGEPPITFFQWLLLGVPIIILFLPLTWAVLMAFGGEVSFFRRKVRLDVGEMLRKEYQALGPLSGQERAVIILFASAALMWIFREPIALGAFTIPGWSRLFPNPAYLHDSVVAIFMAILLFILRVQGKPLLTWKEVEGRIPWGVLLLFGGGFALAETFTKSGLAGWVGQHLKFIADLPPFLSVLCITLIMTFLTEVCSNTAITATMLPVFAAIVPPGTHPVAYLLPATIGASCAFMLPAGTPPNAIVFSSGHLTVARMAKTGLIMNLTTAVIITVLSLTLIPVIFH